MRIIRLEASNVLCLRAVAIDANRNLVRMTGANGQGKSAVINSIFYALEGSRGHPSQPIRHGEQRADIRLDLGDIIVHRRFTPGGTSLDVVNRDGLKYMSPQSVLDALHSKTFDPLAFSRLSAKEQLEQLRGIVHVDADLDALDRQARQAYDERREVNRRVGSLEERVNTLAAELNPGADVEPIDVTALLTAMEEAQASNVKREHALATRSAKAQEILSLTRFAEECRAKAKSLIEKAETADSEAATLGAWLDALAPIGEPQDVSEIRERIRTAGALNAARERQHQARIAHQRAVDELHAASLESQNLTEVIADCLEEKQGAIARAKMPIDGLSFGDGEVTYNGVPLSQASSAEQIRVATSIGMALNPTLRILCIRDGSLLDEHSLAALEQMAIDHDFQVWIEQVDTSGTVGITMIDGEIASIDGEPVDVVAESTGAAA